MVELAIIVAVLVGVGQTIKGLGLPKKYLPALNVVLGIVFGIFFMDGTMQEQVLYGIMAGLSASGLFDQSKLIKKK